MNFLHIVIFCTIFALMVTQIHAGPFTALLGSSVCHLKCLAYGSVGSDSYISCFTPCVALLAVLPSP
jgi:hypothetical protein